MDHKGGGGSRDSAKRRIEYNLEKDPLRTGRAERGIDFRSQVAMGDTLRTANRRMGGWMFVILVSLMLFIGCVVVYYMRDIMLAIYGDV